MNVFCTYRTYIVRIRTYFELKFVRYIPDTFKRKSDSDVYIQIRTKRADPCAACWPWLYQDANASEWSIELQIWPVEHTASTLPISKSSGSFHPTRFHFFSFYCCARAHDPAQTAQGMPRKRRLSPPPPPPPPPPWHVLMTA